MLIFSLLLDLLFLKGGDFMTSIAIIYATLIIDGAKTFNQVPTSLQADVKTYLASLGYNTDMTPITEA